MSIFGGNKDKKIVIPGYEEPEEKNVEIGGDTIILPMEDGSTQAFHILDNIDYKNEQYLVLLADDDITETDEETNFEVTIVHITEVKVNSDFEPEFEVEPVGDQKIIDAVFEIFQDHIEVEEED